MREQLKEIGIDMEIEQVDVSVWFDRFSTGDYQITSAYQERTIDPDNFYSLVVRTGGRGQHDAVLEPRGRRPDRRRGARDRRRQAQGDLRQIRKIVQQDAPLVFAHYETINYLMNKNVAGSTVNPTLELRLGDVGFTG